MLCGKKNHIAHGLNNGTRWWCFHQSLTIIYQQSFPHNTHGLLAVIVCVVIGLRTRFWLQTCLLLGNATETVSQIKACAIYGIRYTRTNYFWLGNTLETVQLNKMVVIRGKQPTRMNCLRWEIITQTVTIVSSCAILFIQKTLKIAN